jgi:hypothetical protein
MTDVERYLFEGVGDAKFPNDEYQNRLEERLEDLLIDEGKIEI